MTNTVLVIIDPSSTDLTITQQITDTEILVTIPGPKGDDGAPGVAGNVYQHTQASAATVWTVPHNLGYKPVVNVSTVGGVSIIVEVLHMTNNTLQILFDEPTAGFAVLT